MCFRQRVGPRGHYSNPSPPGKPANRTPRFRADLLDLGLWEDIEGLVNASTVPGRPKRRRPRQLDKKQVQRHLALGEVEQLIASYLAGATAIELAEAYGIHRTTALAVLERHQVPRRGRVWTSDRTRQAVDLYAEGRSCAAIARRFKVNPETIRQHLLAAGVVLRRPGRPLPRQTP